MFLSELLPEINSFGGFFETAVGNSGNADSDKVSVAVVLCTLLVHGVAGFWRGQEGAGVGFAASFEVGGRKWLEDCDRGCGQDELDAAAATRSKT